MHTATRSFGVTIASQCSSVTNRSAAALVRERRDREIAPFLCMCEVLGCLDSSPPSAACGNAPNLMIDERKIVLTPAGLQQRTRRAHIMDGAKEN